MTADWTYFSPEMSFRSFLVGDSNRDAYQKVLAATTPKSLAFTIISHINVNDFVVSPLL